MRARRSNPGHFDGWRWGHFALAVGIGLTLISLGGAASLASAGLLGQAGNAGSRPEAPSEKTTAYKAQYLEVHYPRNWMVDANGSAFTLYPEGGKVNGANGQSSIAYGVIGNLFDPSENGGPAPAVGPSTDRLIQSLRKGNPGLHVSQGPEKMKLSGKEALSTYLTNESPLGGRETDWLVTARWNDALYYVICIAPEGDFGAYQKTFKSVVASVRLRG